MRVLSIGSDRALFEEGSAVRERARAYAAALGALDIIVFSRGTRTPVHDGPLSVYPTNSRMRLGYIRDAVHIAHALGRSEVVTAQDPFESGMAALRIAVAMGAKLHIQLHTDPFAPAFAKHSLINRIRLFLMTRVIRHADRIRVVSEDLREELIAHYHPRAPVSVLPVFTDLSRFSAIARAPERGFILWIGRFETEKDPFLALEAFREAALKYPEAKLVMIGEGSLRGAVMARARGLPVMFPGHVDPLPYLARADLVIATSRYEGYGLSIVEALAAGVPVLSTEVGIARAAGATLAKRSGFAHRLQAMLEEDPRTGKLLLPGYASLQEYVTRYTADIRATSAHSWGL